MTQIGPQFPNFFLETMFRSGVSMVRDGSYVDWDYTQHGEEGARFYLMGVRAAEPSLISA